MVTASGAPEWTVVPLVPLTVKLKVPTGAVAATATVIVDAAAPVVDCGLNVTVVPDGRPLALRSTRPVKPPSADTETVNALLLPGAIVPLVGVTLRAKSGAPPNSP